MKRVIYLILAIVGIAMCTYILYTGYKRYLDTFDHLDRNVDYEIVVSRTFLMSGVLFINNDYAIPASLEAADNSIIYNFIGIGSIIYKKKDIDSLLIVNENEQKLFEFEPIDEWGSETQVNMDN